MHTHSLLMLLLMLWLLFTGGRINSSYVWMYNSQLNIWIRVAFLNKGRWRHKMTVLLGKVRGSGVRVSVCVFPVPVSHFLNQKHTSFSALWLYGENYAGFAPLCCTNKTSNANKYLYFNCCLGKIILIGSNTWLFLNGCWWRKMILALFRHPHPCLFLCFSF